MIQAKYARVPILSLPSHPKANEQYLLSVIQVPIQSKYVVVPLFPDPQSLSRLKRQCIPCSFESRCWKKHGQGGYSTCNASIPKPEESLPSVKTMLMYSMLFQKQILV